MRAYREKNLELVKAGQRAHYERNRDEVRAKVKAYQIENAEAILARKRDHYRQNRLALIAKSSRYVAENREKVRAASREYSIRNREKIVTRVKAWVAANPEKAALNRRVRVRNYFARKSKAEGAHTVADVRALYDSQKGKCAACTIDLLAGYHVDHIVALAKGGSNWPCNLQLLCPTCNVRKNSMSMEEFMKRNAK